MKTILGKKIGMTQIFTDEGEMVPVTVVEAGPVTITQVKTEETDGYEAIQIAFEDQKEHRLTKPLKGHYDKNGIGYKKYLTEARLEVEEDLKVGQVISVIDFEEGKKLDVTGTSKGKGTQGNIKRHGHARGPMTHGSKHKRLPGALAAGTYPSRVFKGNAGPGRMGRDTITVQNVELVKIIAERNVMLIKGAVPGGRGSILRIQYAVKDSESIKEVGPTGKAAPAEEVKEEAAPAPAEVKEETPAEEAPKEEAAPAEEEKAEEEDK